MHNVMSQGFTACNS